MLNPLTASFLLAFAVPAPSPPPRSVVPLDTGWSFEGPSVDGRGVRATVTLPHTWNAADTLDGVEYARGVGTYTRTLPIDASAAARRVFLRFEGANTVADVEVNGKAVGQHRGGYTAFAFEITRFVVPGGENRLVVRVDNRPQPDVMPTGGDFNVYGGLHRPAWLVTTGPVGISLLDHASPGVYLRQPKVSEAEAQVFRWWIKPLYVASALLAFFLFARGFGDRPASRARTAARVLYSQP